MWMVRLALGNIHAVIVLALFILVLGLVALATIPVDILPAFHTPAAQVLTYYAGMPADSIEKTISSRIERGVNQAPGVDLIESRSLPGVSVVRVYFRDDIDSNSALTMANTLANNTLAFMPPNTLPPVVLPFDPTGTMPLGVLTVNNPHMRESDIKDLARLEVRSMLGSVKGSVAPAVVGGKDRTILVYLDPKQLQARKLSMTDVVKALADGNMMASPGTAYFGKNQMLLDSNAMVPDVDDLNSLPIRLPSGEVIELSDVGHAEDAAAIQTSRVRINGRAQVYVPIYRQGGASSLAVAEGVKNALPGIEKRLPEDTKLEFVMDQSVGVRKAIESLIHEGVVGAILVSVMILIFLGNWRMTIIASMSIPLAILTAIIGLRAFGDTINVMTLGGLFLSIGPLVDDAIVVLENIHRHLGMGKNPTQAAADGTSEVTLPVLVATLSLIIVLCPVALTPGVSGFLFKPMTMAVAFAMLASFVLSRTFVPALSAKLVRSHGPVGGPHHEHDHGADFQPKAHGFFSRVHRRIERVLEFVNRVYGRLLDRSLRNRGWVLAAVALLFCVSLLQLFGIGREYFPQVDAGQITMQVRAPSHSRLDATEERVAEVERFLQEQIPAEERAMIISEMGLNPDWSSAYTLNSGQQDAVLRIQLTDKRRFSAQEYAVKLRHAFKANPHFSDLDFSFDTGGMVSAALNFGASSPIDVQMEGGSADQAQQAARDIRRQVTALRGAADVRVAQRTDAPYMVLDVRRQKALEVGLSTRDVIQQVVAAINSSTSINRNFWIDEKSGNQYYVAVQYTEDPDRRLEDLSNVFATGTNQSKPVALSSLVELKQRTSSVEVNHASMRRVTDVLINTEARDIGSLAKEVNRELDALRAGYQRKVEELRPRVEKLRGQVEEAKKARTNAPGLADELMAAEKDFNDAKAKATMHLTLKGEYARMTESGKSLGIGLVLASILVYLLMVPLMRSFVGPLIIMATVPLGLIGVLTILFATGTMLNIQSEMGVIFLVGIVVSQGMLLIDFANQLRKQGLSVREAMTRSAATRFRPIMMTFLATFLDLLPMALGLGRGSEALTPLARAVVGGLLTSTFLTLIVVPILYTLLIRDRRKDAVHAGASGVA
jgi:multidrug efflux pump subunit AcrB